MRLVASLTSILLAGSLNANPTAQDFYAQCSGQGLMKQAQAHYQGASCQTTGTCSPFDPDDYRVEIVRDCYETTVDICVAFDGSDACIRELNDLLSQEVADRMAEFPENRIRSAAVLAAGLRGPGLLRALEERQAGIPELCGDSLLIQRFERIGVSKDTLCSGLQALISLSRESYIERLTRDAEAEQQ